MLRPSNEDFEFIREVIEGELGKWLEASGTDREDQCFTTDFLLTRLRESGLCVAIYNKKAFAIAKDAGCDGHPRGSCQCATCCHYDRSDETDLNGSWCKLGEKGFHACEAAEFGSIELQNGRCLCMWTPVESEDHD